MAQRAARVRIEPQLPPGVMWNEATGAVTALTGTTDFSHMATQEFISRVRDHQRMIEEAARSLQGRSSGPTTGEGPERPGQGGQLVSDSDPDVQQAIQQSLEPSETGSQSGGRPGQGGQSSGSGGATTTGQAPDDVSSDPAAAAAALQHGLDRSGGGQTPGPSCDMQNTTGSRADSSETGPQGTGTGSGNATSTTGAERSRSSANQQDPSVSDDEQQQEIPRTTALLNRIPLFMVPGKPEYEEQRRERQAAREEARQRIEDAHAAARAAGLPAPALAIAPAADGSQSAGKEDAGSTGGLQGGEEGMPTPTIADSASNAEDSQTETGDTDDETMRGDSPVEEDNESEQYSPPEDSPADGNTPGNNDNDSLFDETLAFDFDGAGDDGNFDGFDGDGNGDDGDHDGLDNDIYGSWV